MNSNKNGLKLLDSAEDIDTENDKVKTKIDGPTIRFGPELEYAVENNCLIHYKLMVGVYRENSKQRENKDPLPDEFKRMKKTDFIARIVEEKTYDDGLSQEIYYTISGLSTRNNELLPLIEVSANDFANTNKPWFEAWGSRVTESVGGCGRQHINTATKYYSRQWGDVPKSTLFLYTGWRRNDLNKWEFLTNSGAISESGLDETISVDLGPGNVNKIALPGPLAGDELRDGLNELFKFLDEVTPTAPEISIYLLALAFRAPLSTALPTNFVSVICGQTEAFKSSLTAVFQSFFGKFTDLDFVSNWDDSETDLQYKSHSLYGCLHVVDDLKIEGTKSNIEKITEKFGKIVRAVGNQAGRHRRQTTMKALPVPHPRSTILVTSEGLPTLAPSIFNRLIIMQLRRGVVDLEVLTRGQALAADGALSGIMSAYLKWLAPRLDETRENYIADARALRASLSVDNANRGRRHTDVYAGMLVSLEYFADFVSAALPGFESGEFLNRAKLELSKIFENQFENQRDSDEIRRFFRLLHEALLTGECHVADAYKKKQPKDINERLHKWGWSTVNDPAAQDDDGKEFHHPRGVCVGYLQINTTKNNELILLPETAFRTVSNLAKLQGEPFLTPKGILQRLFVDRGVLSATENLKDRPARPDVKRPRVCAPRVWVFDADIFDTIESDADSEETENVE